MASRISQPKVAKKKQRKNTVTTMRLVTSSKKLRKNWNTARQVKILDSFAYPRNKQIAIKALSTGNPVMRKGKKLGTPRYLTSITYSAVDLVDARDRKHAIPIMPKNAKRGTKPLYMKSILKRQNPIECRCTCPDFYFVWGWALKRRGALLGSHMVPYVRKTPLPPVGYPRRNPRHILGYCKHIKALIESLNARGIIK